jgi:hypothetical protein
VLTDEGYRKLQDASETHVADLRTYFETRYSSEELERLAALLGRLPVEAAGAEDCSVD